MVNTILAKRVNHIVAKGDHPVWPKGSKSHGFSNNEVYEKRHQRIEEKKAVLLVQEQAKQEAEQTEADADNEKQPQSQEVAA